MKTDSELQSAACKIVAVVTPVFAVAQAAIPALKIVASIPACPSNPFSHLASVEEVIGLCGFTTAKIVLFAPSSSLHGRDLFSFRLQPRLPLGREPGS